MCLERFLSASFAGSSVSLNFRNWRQRTCRSEKGWIRLSSASSSLLTAVMLVKRPRSTHLNLLIAGGELPLLKDEDVVSDPLQQHGDQLIILLPTQLQLLKHRHRQRFTLNNWRINFSWLNWRPDFFYYTEFQKTHPLYIFSLKRDYKFFMKLGNLLKAYFYLLRTSVLLYGFMAIMLRAIY